MIDSKCAHRKGAKIWLRFLGVALLCYHVAFAQSGVALTAQEICITHALESELELQPNITQALQKTSGPVAIVISEPFNQQIDVSIRNGNSFNRVYTNEAVTPSLLIARTNSTGEALPEPLWFRDGRGDVNHVSSITSDAATGAKKTSLDIIYKNYAQQGPERSEELGTYQSEDREAASYTTNFMEFTTDSQRQRVQIYQSTTTGKPQLTEKLDPLSHVQMQVSSDPSVPLNTERHTGPFDRTKGEIYGDLGRVSNPPKDQFPSEFKDALEARFPRTERFRLGVQRAVSWFLHSANGTDLVFQTNDVVRTFFTDLMGAENIKDLKETHVHGHEAVEWRFHLNREQMKNAEERMIKTEILGRVNEALHQLEAHVTDKYTLVSLRFHPLPFETEAYRNILGSDGQDSAFFYVFGAAKNLDKFPSSPADLQIMLSKPNSLYNLRDRLERELGIASK